MPKVGEPVVRGQNRKPALRQGDLDEMSCSTLGCTSEEDDIFYLHGSCHVGGRIEVVYVKASGVLVIGCKECGKNIASVAVAF